MNIHEELWDRLNEAAMNFAISWHKVKELTAEEFDEERVSRAMGQHILNLHALRDALELTPGLWDENDIELGLAAVKGEVNIVHLYREHRKQEKMMEMLNEAVVHGPDGGEVQLPAGEHHVVVTEAWRDEDGQLHVCIDQVSDDE